MSGRGNVGEMGKSPVREVSVREVSGREIVHLGKCSLGKCPSGKSQSGICFRESASRETVQSVNCPHTVIK